MSDTIDRLEPPIYHLPEQGEVLTAPGFTLQTPQEFRDDFVAVAGRSTQLVGLETMQFEINSDTQPIFDVLKREKQMGTDVRFHYDRVALTHIRTAEGEDKSEAFVMLGRTALHKGNKPGLQQANTQRKQLVDELETMQVTTPSNRKRGKYPHLSHNHAKVAIADSVAWFGTMNLRGIDFEMSNFMVKVQDPYFVDALKVVFEQTEETELGEDKKFVKYDEQGRPETELILDAGVKGRSAIYNTALEMADSLQEGDEFTLISQWPPVKIMYGALSEKLHAKTEAGTHGTYLMSPEKDLHPNRKAAHALQEQVNKMQLLDPNMTARNLARQTHAKAFLIKRADGSREVLFGSHNLTSWTVRNGTRELAMWSKDPEIVNQISSFLETVENE